MRRTILQCLCVGSDLFMESQSMFTNMLAALFLSSPSRPATNWSTRCHFGSEAFLLTKLLSSPGSILAISLAARNSWNVKWRKQYCVWNLKIEMFLFCMRWNKPQFSIPCTSYESNASRPSSIPFIANAPALFKVTLTVSRKSSLLKRKSCVNGVPLNSEWCLKINNFRATFQIVVEVDGKAMCVRFCSWSLRHSSNRVQKMHVFRGM